MGNIRIKQIGLQFGRFPRATEATKEGEEPEAERIESVLEQLGTVKSAVVVYPPYSEGAWPAIIFELSSDRNVRILQWPWIGPV